MHRSYTYASEAEQKVTFSIT